MQRITGEAAKALRCKALLCLGHSPPSTKIVHPTHLKGHTMPSTQFQGTNSTVTKRKTESFPDATDSKSKNSSFLEVMPFFVQGTHPSTMLVHPANTKGHRMPSTELQTPSSTV